MENQLCTNCEVGHMHIDVRDIIVERRGLTGVVTAVRGAFCDHCDEVYFDPETDSAERYAAAGEALAG